MKIDYLLLLLSILLKHSIFQFRKLIVKSLDLRPFFSKNEIYLKIKGLSLSNKMG